MKRLCVIGCLLVPLSACGAVEMEPLKIGYIGPITGKALSYGTDTVNGTRMAVEEMNALGDVRGRNVELIVHDADCDSEKAKQAARKLIEEDKVIAIIGGQCSAETLGAAPIAEAARVIMISPVSSSPDVTNAGNFIFRVYPSDAQKTKAMAKYLHENGRTRLAMISEDTPFAGAFRDDLLDKMGGNVIFDVTVPPDTLRFGDLMQSLKGKEFDTFFPNIQSDVVMAALMNDFRKAGFRQPAITHDVGDSMTLGTFVEEAIEGMEIVTVPTAVHDRVFAGRYVNIYGIPQQSLPFAAHAYDATMVLLQAVKDVGTDSAAIRDYLLDLPSYEGATGSFHFDENGDVVGIPFVLKRFHNGKMMTTIDELPVE
jgi:branched-chain amino acid transport system substrate-binding protein